jgi:hypothetical protein
MPTIVESPDAPGWHFVVQDAFHGAYRIDGRDAAGHLISRSGSNLDATLRECVEGAQFLSTMLAGLFGALDWAQVAEEFQCDGGLRDIYVLGTTEADWDQVLSRLAQYDPTPIFSVAGEMQSLPHRFAPVFKLRDTYQALLTVMVGDAVLNCHFFHEGEIEFDCDPREITGPRQAGMLAAFMRLLGETTGKPVILCHENTQQAVIARYSPLEGEVVWRIAGDGGRGSK